MRNSSTPPGRQNETEIYLSEKADRKSEGITKGSTKMKGRGKKKLFSPKARGNFLSSRRKNPLSPYLEIMKRVGPQKFYFVRNI